MTQLNLPLYQPRDRGRLNALRNILASVSDELRQQAPVAQGIVDFVTVELPNILRQTTPFQISTADNVNPVSASPYDFEIHDLVQMQNRPEVFPAVSELVQNINVASLTKGFQNVELIGIDESQVDNPLPQSAITYLKSIAFRMYKLPNGATDEAVGPILSETKMQLREDEDAFESKNKLLSYIRNNFVAYSSALTALAFGRTPLVILHGPLVRAIGGFSQLTFDYETARNLFNIDVGDAGEFDLPKDRTKPTISGDSETQNNMSFSIDEMIDGDKNLRRFNEFCLKSCGRKCAVPEVRRIYGKAVPPSAAKVTKKMITGRDYPGFCLYFWMLRSLLDLSRLAEVLILSVVEDVSSATEMTRLILPSLLANPAVRRRVENSSLRPVLQAANIGTFPTQPHQRSDLYKKATTSIERLRLADANIFSYVLSEGQYTSPVQIYRYRTRNTFERTLADSSLGIRNEFEDILDALFSANSQTNNHPGYRVLMSYVRTSPLREPIRVEYFDLPHLNPPERVIGPTYLLSLPYQEYGIPIILYYADKLARTPTKIIRTIIEREYLDLVIQNRFSDPVSIMRVLGRLSRGYFQREGLR